MKKSKTNKRKGFNIPGMKNMKCPYCNSAVLRRSADGIYKNNKDDTQLYVCSKYPACDSYVRIHKGTDIPVGSLANPQLRALRVKAHKQFDKLHQCGIMSKKEAYGWLAHMLQSPKSQAHIGYLSEYYCNLVISESGKMFDNFKWKRMNIAQGSPVTGGEIHAAQ